MFAPYCEYHGSRVLLPTSAITALMHSKEGMIVDFVCSCGTPGTWHTGAARAARSA